MPRTMLLKTIERRIRELMQKAEEIKRRKDTPLTGKVVSLMREHLYLDRRIASCDEWPRPREQQ